MVWICVTLAMSFGWSAGDIAAAINSIYNIAQGLDTANGAVGDYRNTVLFLKDLKRTLEPLQSCTAFNLHSAYAKDINEQVDCIKGPVSKYLEKILKYEPSLGSGVKGKWYSHIVRKLDWYLFMSNKTVKLREKIELRMRILDSLMQRLIV